MSYNNMEEYVKKFIVNLEGEKFSSTKEVGRYLNEVAYSLGFVLTAKAPNPADFVDRFGNIDVYKCRFTGDYEAYEDISEKEANELIKRFGKQIIIEA